jgi:hypothetical protein
MQDNLKQYVEEHREELDIYQPRELLWGEINERVQRSRVSIRWQRLAMAASVLLALAFGTWIYRENRQSKQSESIVQAQSPLMQAEAYYTAMVFLKDAELEQYCKPQPELCREFEGDIESLSEAYRQLRAEYATSADRQALLRAMATNLQMQVQLITRQLQIMEAVTQKKEAYKTI